MPRAGRWIGGKMRNIKKLDIFVNLVYHRGYLMGTGLVSDISKNRKNYAY